MDMADSGSVWHISNARMIDGTEREFDDRPYSLLVQGGTIKAVAPSNELACPDGVTAIDAAA